MSNSDRPHRLRATLGLITTTVLLPLALLAFGLWQQGRGLDDQQEAEARQAGIAKVVARLEARPVPSRGFDSGAVFRDGGHNYAGPLALIKAREALGQRDTAVTVARARRVLPPVVIGCGAVVGVLSALMLLAAAVLGRLGRRSRDALVRGFSLVRHLLPPVLGAQVVLLAVGFVAAVIFEAAGPVLDGGFSTESAKLLGIAAIAVGASLWTAARAVLQLRGTVKLFAPDPLAIIGRTVSPAEAPGLWRVVDKLAARLGALRPDNVVVGLSGGFFVSSGPKLLQPGDAPLGGRTLYLPLPFLALLPEDEVAAIIGHELAHFSGGDTEYSLRFLPIYAGVGRSLDAVVEAGRVGDGTVSPLMRPALRLGLFVMDQFHHAVRHWSRLREFAADAAGAEVTSAGAAARALLRTSAADPRIGETLAPAFQAPRSAPPDLLAAILAQAAERGLDDPAGHLEAEQPHPTDTHPPTRQRIQALGQQPGPALLAEAMAPPPPGALARLGGYFAEPDRLCHAATEDFVAVARQAARQERDALHSAATEVGTETVTVAENRCPQALLLTGVGVLFALAGLALAAFGLSGLSMGEAWLIGGVAGGIGLLFLAFGLFRLRQGNPPVLVLRPDEVLVVGLQAPVAWRHVLDVAMTGTRNGVETRLLLSAETPFPARLAGGRRVTVDARRRVVTVPMGAPRGMSPQGLADLVGRYRRADAARRVLAEHEQSDEAPP